ncbi:MAG: protoheme IX farnesyltransferase, partial [Chloroflexi bacterium]|nr:protoheme IX farnesyltransferase [Chloroflexota bacterium]
MLASCIQLAKPRTLGLLVFVALAAAITAQGGLSPLRLALLAISGAMASAGSAWLNNYLDRDIDAVMERTKTRVLPRKKLSPRLVLLGGLALVVASLPVAAALGFLVAISVLLGALVYVVVYTGWLKRRSPLNIVLGGTAGSCAVLAGWFTTGGSDYTSAALLALLLFLWTPPHFWSFAIANEASYLQARVPMLPNVAGNGRAAARIMLASLILTPVALGLLSSDRLGLQYGIAAIIMGIVFAFTSFRL